ncbi:MAG: GMC family oxidoreductase N-terminal domain-containing protein [Cucumibacter sp.]
MRRNQKFDFIIAGGGSAACVAAMRLVRDHGFSVLVLERGPRRTSPTLAMPAGYMKYLNRDTFMEMHRSVPQAQLGGRAPIVPQARVLGGGSAVNALVYMRGQPQDYNAWEQYVGPGSGWSYADMLPHFTALERNSRFNNRYHGIDGPLAVSDPGSVCDATEDFLRAAQGIGFPFNPDFNGERQAGVGIMQLTTGRFGGRLRRADAASAFLAPLKRDRRLAVLTGARVDKIIVEGGRATGIEYRRNGKGPALTLRAEREVLVAAGTYNTAKLLMLSGLGPADHLADNGIAAIADLPGVGANLQDHHEVPVVASARVKWGYFRQDTGWRMWRNGLQYLAFGTGPVSTTGIEACLFYDPDGAERPTVQLYCIPTVYLDRDITSTRPTYGMTLNSCLLRPRARGSVRLRSANPDDKPLVDCNFFGHPEDLRLTIASLRIARQILDTQPIAEKIARELLPGESLVADERLAQHCARTVKTTYHPVGTARMGPPHDPLAVLDARLRVRGIDGLRVIDCAAMPFLPSGNTNAPAMALGSRAADLIAADHNGETSVLSRKIAQPA